MLIEVPGLAGQTYRAAPFGALSAGFGALLWTCGCAPQGAPSPASTSGPAERVGAVDAGSSGFDMGNGRAGLPTVDVRDTGAATPSTDESLAVVDAGGGGSSGHGGEGDAPAMRTHGSEGTGQGTDQAPGPEIHDATVAMKEDAGLRSDADSGVSQGTHDAQVDGPAAPASPGFILPPATTARLETLVPPADMPSSENGSFTEDGRLFVIGGDSIFEIVGGPDTFDAVVFATGGGCIFGGLTARGPRLYATCTNILALSGELLVYEPALSRSLVGRAMIRSEAPSHFNGMAFGPDGALYVSNYLANDVDDPAVERLELLQEEPLSLVQTAFVAASSPARAPDTGGGSAPNGLRFAADVMYLVRGPDVVAVPVTLDDPTAPLEVVYEAQRSSSTIDDFEIVDGRMWLAQFRASALLGLPQRGQLIVADLEGNVQFQMDLPFIPSSTIVTDDDRFGRSILLTDFFEGGLYRVTFSAAPCLAGSPCRASSSP